METPVEVLNAIKRAVAKNASDAAATVEAAIKAVRALPSFQDHVNFLIDFAIQDLTYDVRSSHNGRIDAIANGREVQPQKVYAGLSAAVRRAMDSAYSYMISGTTLGEVYGSQLGDIAQEEEQRARGSMKNAAICLKLKHMVPSGKRVRDAVSERQLRIIIADADKTAKKNVA